VKQEKTNVLDELKWRGLFYDATDGLAGIVSRESLTAYIGFDPTADSLHVGTLIPIMGLARLQRFGHTPIALAGGGTGMIGDPSGKSDERPLLSKEQIEANVEAIEVQLASLLDFDVKSNPARIVNNADWLAPLSMMDFLRGAGKHLTVNYMMAKDSVKSRLQGEGGISFTEFSYMLLQAYDYLHLFNRHGCRLQAGGSDQWGNIIAGVELIRRMRGERVHGLVYPLLTKADGSKFGKTESGTVWLDPKRTSPFRFYQFWWNTGDADIVRYLRYFSWRTKEEIGELEEVLEGQPEKREAQLALAEEMTLRVHGESGLAAAKRATRVLFGEELTELGADDIQDIFSDVPSSSVPKGSLEGEGMQVVELLVATGLATSKGDARRSIDGGGIYLNNVKLQDRDKPITLARSVEGQFIVLRKGRRNYHLVRVSG
jgi:tyrosyl-tRNA synthetase